MDPNAIPARAHTLSIMYVNPGQGNAAHTHEVEETFFVLKGLLDVFVEDEDGRRLETRLGPWECITCPPGVIHGYDNASLEPVWFQVMLGRGQPETMGYADKELFERRGDHRQEITGNDHLGVIGHESGPALIATGLSLRVFRHVLSYRTGRYLDPELE